MATTSASRRAGGIAALLIVLAAGLFTLRRLHDFDILWHVRTGDWILAEGRVPMTDPFGSLTAGDPWIAVSWAADVAMALGARAFGLEGLQAGAVLLVMACLGSWLWRTPRDPIALWSALLFVLVCWSRFLVRPDLLSLPLVMLTVVMADRLPRLGWQGVAALAALAVAWCNMHGSFVLAPLLLGAGLVGQLIGRAPVRWHAAALLAALAAPLASPYGLRLYTLLAPYVESLRAGAGDAAARTLTLVEWRATWRELLFEPSFPRLAFPLLVVVLALSFIRVGGPARNAGRLVQAAGLLGLSLTAVRHVLPFAAGALALIGLNEVDRAPLTGHGDRSPGAGAWWRLAMQSLAAAVAAAVCFAVVTDRYYVTRDVPLRTGIGLDLRLVPEGAAAYLAAHDVPEPVFNNFNAGAYLHWRLWPHYAPYVDARLVSAAKYFAVREDISSADRFEARATRENLEVVVLVHPSNETFTLLPHLASSDDWHLAFRDKISTVHVRSHLWPVPERRPPLELAPPVPASARRFNGLFAPLKYRHLPAADLTDALVARLAGHQRREVAAFRRAWAKAPDHPRVRAFFAAHPSISPTESGAKTTREELDDEDPDANDTHD